MIAYYLTSQEYFKNDVKAVRGGSDHIQFVFSIREKSGKNGNWSGKSQEISSLVLCGNPDIDYRSFQLTTHRNFK